MFKMSKENRVLPKSKKTLNSSATFSRKMKTHIKDVKTSKKKAKPPIINDARDSSDEEIDYNFSKNPKANSTVANKSQTVPNDLMETADQSSSSESVLSGGDTEDAEGIQVKQEYNWTKSDLLELITSIKAHLPKPDKVVYTKRKKTLHWEKIKFGPYTAFQCEQQWSKVEKTLRTTKSLSELLDDATSLVTNDKLTFRNPDLPKKPMGAFFLFLTANYQDLRTSNPKMSHPEITKVAAAKFNNLSKEEKDVIQLQVEEAKRIYHQKLEQYYLDHPDKKKIKIDMVKPEKQAKKRKISSIDTPMFRFIADQLGRDLNPSELSKLKTEYSEKWKRLSDDLKLPWIKLIVKHETKLWKRLSRSDSLNDFKSELTNQEKRIYINFYKPDQPPNLRTFYEISRYTNKTNSLKPWKELPSAMKNEYTMKHNEIMQKYNEECAAYLQSLPPYFGESAKNPTPKKSIPKINVSTPTSAKAKTPKPVIKEMLLAKEPLQPPSRRFDLFANKEKALGVSDLDIQKKWNKLSEQKKNEYELQLESMKQKYILDYKNFLSSLKPSELKLFSTLKGNTLDNEEDEEQCTSNEDDDEEEEEDNQTIVKEENSSDDEDLSDQV